MKKFKVGSLFAGVGGICLGFQNAKFDNKGYEIVLANSMAFLEYRTKGETPEKLKKLTGINYNNTEIAKPDKFFNSYCGKIYDRATEIMSMGLQRVFEDPENFMKEDKEYFDFVIANLQGKI